VGGLDKRTAASVVVIGVFSLMLVGTSRPPGSGIAIPADADDDDDGADADAPESGPIPDTTAWRDVTLPSLKLTLKVPAGATARGTANDVTVTMPSGYVLYVRPARKTSPVAETKSFYMTRARGALTIEYDANDAIIAFRDEKGSVGAYCEVTACNVPVAKPLCVEMAGAIVSSSTVSKLTNGECFDVVAMVRSLKAVP
jgi:hypothetical protein